MITMSEARGLYTRGNNAGQGYAPYTDVAGDDTVDEAVEAAVEDGWELVLPRETSDDVTVLRNGDDELMGIGGDAMGRGAWAVILTDVAAVDSCPLCGEDRNHPSQPRAGHRC